MRAILEAISRERLSVTAALTLEAAASEDMGASISSIACRAGVSAAAMTGVVDRLEKMQLVRRERPLSDRRSIHVVATNKGLAMLARISAEARKGAE